MDVIIFTIGTILIVIGILDIFITIIYYDGNEFISSFLQRMFWNVIKTASTAFPLHTRLRILASGAPLMIVLTLLFWIGIEITGFTFIFYTGLRENHFLVNTSNSSNAFLTALYFSGVTLPTLGFGDITPSNFFFQIASSIEALIGFTIMTLSLTYILNIYKVIQQFRVLASELFHETSNTGDAMIMIENHWNSHTFTLGDMYFSRLTHVLLEWFENIHQYPIAYYFFSSRTHLSIPFTFKTIGDMLALYFFCAPSPDVFSNSPSLKQLYNSYTSILPSLFNRFSRKHLQPVTPVNRDIFINNLNGQNNSEPYILHFLSSLRIMEDFTGRKYQQNSSELYLRFCQWFLFISYIDQFTSFTTSDLGYVHGNKGQ